MDQKIALPNGRALLREAWSFYRQNQKTILSIQIVPLVLVVLGVVLAPTMPLLSAIFSFVGSIVTAFAVLTLLIFITRYGAMGAMAPAIRELYRSSIGLIWPFVLVGILNALVMMGGAILLVFPAIILAIALGFNAFVLVLEDQRGLRALATSWSYVSGSWWRVFWRQIALVVVVGLTHAIISTVASVGGKVVGNVVSQLFIVLIFTPISLIYGFVLYNYLKTGVKNKIDAVAFEAKVAHYRKWLVYFAIIGFVVLVGLVPLILAWNGVFSR